MSLENLHQLFVSSSNLPSVGEKTFAALERLNCSRVIDLLLHFPYEIIKREFYPDLSKLSSKSLVVVEVEIQNISKSFTRSRKKITKILTYDGRNHLSLVYFNFIPHYIINKLVIGNKYIVSGKLEQAGLGEYQIAHPEIYLSDQTIKNIEVKYPLTYAITSKQISNLVNHSLTLIPNFPEWLPTEILAKHKWLGWLESLNKIHYPNNNQDLDPNSPYKQRIAFDELLASQLTLKLIRRNKDYFSKGHSIAINHTLRDKVLKKLGFTLTEGQQKALKEIDQDQALPNRMMRLLQGDVGSGKTLVALCAMLNVVSANKQAALMVPTDILANQHFKWIQQVVGDLGIEVVLLTGNTKKAQRTKLLDDLKQNKINILVGTHAIFQKGVEFHDLQLIVIDEQHRFGVEQRLSLMNKGANSDVLVMSATPIPRTLALTAYGDMDISILPDKPEGRLPIQTSTISISRVAEIAELINRKIKMDEKVFWVCPMIEIVTEDDSPNIGNNSDISAVMDRYDYLCKFFDPKLIGLIHGKLSNADKDAAMDDFASGKTKILIATTVIEVGINIPEATLLIIENAERFGLAQLHQLRGRVGRGSKKSDCILLFGKVLSQTAKSRLQTMRASNDGFYIAEQDLQLRGGGDILGLKQSGMPQFRTADLEYHRDLLLEAHQLAEHILNQDSKLSSVQYNPLRTLLSLFQYDQYLNFIYAG
jgi:ATP-dependent DNA helicase RecG